MPAPARAFGSLALTPKIFLQISRAQFFSIRAEFMLPASVHPRVVAIGLTKCQRAT